ncbi:MAG: hypothetical protein JW744_04440 [Candidatus Diapherotrites archaeon]|uniref:Uncharacterized protein n=1 Tax=Candidatus Iainarchaeum sp. TaxID=3101447 RepID=A0A938YRP8_9ARCH|nr:hypothetical protein [Candidatus Diapherotrites archaeon]
MHKDLSKKLEAVKQKAIAVEKEIIERDKAGMALIQKQIQLEDRLDSVLTKMISLEKARVSTAKQKSKKKQASLTKRIERLKKKQKGYEQKRELLKNMKQKSKGIKSELRSIERKIMNETKELYKMHEDKKAEALERRVMEAELAMPGLKAKGRKKIKRAMKKLAKRRAAKKLKPVKKKADAKPVKKVAAKKPGSAGAKPAAKQRPVKAKLKRIPRAAVPVEKPAAKKPGQKIGAEELVKKRPAFLDLLPDQEEAPQEQPRLKPLKLEGIGGKPAKAKKPKTAPAKPVAPKREKPKPVHVKVEKPRPVEKREEPSVETPEDLLSKTMEKAKREKLAVQEKEAPVEREPEPAPEKAVGDVTSDFTEFHTMTVSISHPKWANRKGKPAHSVLSQENGPYSFDLVQVPTQGRTLEDYITQAIVKVESNIGSKVLERRKDTDKAFLVYIDLRNGVEYLNKAIFFLHEDQIYKLVFSSPKDSFGNINELFWKTARSIHFR